MARKQKPDWATLPVNLLAKCASHLADEQERFAAFFACKRLARVVLLSSLQQEQPAGLLLDVDREEPFGPSAKLAQELAGEQDSKGLTLLLFSRRNGSPARCLAELGACGALLTCVTRLEMQVRDVHICCFAH